MRQQIPDQRNKEKVQEALVRERLTVSDDDALESRLASVDLDNPDEVLQVLTNEERMTFENLMKSNEIGTYITVWRPWWTAAKTRIEEVKPYAGHNELAKFKQQRREARPKIGGRKVQNLNTSTTNTDSSNDDKKSNVWDNMIRDYKSNDDSKSSGDPSTNKVVSTKDLAGGLNEEVLDENMPNILVEIVMPDTDGSRFEKKTRIIDSRYRGRNCIVSDAICRENTAEKHTAVESEISVRNPTEGLPQKWKKGGHEVYDGRTTDIQQSIEIGKYTGDFKSDASELTDATSANQNILLDTWIEDSSGSKVFPEWENREKILATNIVNLVTAFAFTSRFFNGDALGMEVDAAVTLESICAVLRGRNFQTIDTAVGDILLQDIVIRNANPNVLVSDVSLILDTAEYVERALFETRNLLKAARRSLKKQPLLTKSSEISFEQLRNNSRIDLTDALLHHKYFKLLMLKVDFYFDWATKNTIRLREWTLPVISLQKKNRQ